jgi:hypothetical protein
MSREQETKHKKKDLEIEGNKLLRVILQHLASVTPMG